MKNKFVLHALVLATIGTLGLTGCDTDSNSHKVKVPTSVKTVGTPVVAKAPTTKPVVAKAPTTTPVVAKTDTTKAPTTNTDTAIKATKMTAEISNPLISDKGVLSFDIDVADENGGHVTGLKTADIGGIALGRIGTTDDVPSMKGAPGAKIWLSYFNGADKYDATQFGGYNKFKGESCPDESCLIDNGDGTYHVTLKDHPITIAPFKFKYDENKVTGIYLSLAPQNDQGATVVANSFYYWTPATGKVANNPKNVIQDAAAKCNSCHQGNHRHSGKHLSSQACSFCHTAYSKGVLKANKDTKLVSSMYIANILHSRHMEFNVTTCSSCHTADKTNADADVNLWHNTSNNAVCTSCHSNEKNPMNKGFTASHFDATTNKLKDYKVNCTQCHTATSTFAPATPHQPK